MATFTAKVAVDVNSLVGLDDFADGTFKNREDDSFTVSLDSVRINVTGSGFHYDPFFSHHPLLGTIEGLSVTRKGNLQYTFTGLDISINPIKLPDLSSNNLLDGNDTLKGSNQADTLRGFNGDDKLFGNGGGDTVKGDSGADTVRGGRGDDIVQGGKGNDTIDGDQGADKATGNSGRDTFVFDSAINRNDRITDLTLSQNDRIELSLGIFAGIGTIGQHLGSNHFAAVGDATGVATILYDQSNGRLFYDADGDGSGDRFGILTNEADVSAGDFVIIA